MLIFSKSSITPCSSSQNWKIRTLAPEDLDWRGDEPLSREFGDVYFSSSSGIEESRHVFLRGNGLTEAWQGRDSFSIGELGFGSGLNFLLCAKTFLEEAHSAKRLHYFSVEGFPFSRSSLKRALSPWQELGTLREELLREYPIAVPGFHRLELAESRICLTLAFGPVLEILRAYRGVVDAWFLDGFSPQKNPEMWSAEVLDEIARRSKRGTTLSTFSAAGSLRRGLEAAG
ncbi:MAG: tRNA (5-methylaminomethyl-2-thiouridine)(34)-methyltransferase MnmD, partial [Bdellovibrionales bacterium]|nr:tRNA (5-methylaminomethyl-2-thiouridine)(34)-methyltransferase MnmD [Bdellovibrionales bacterium]